MSRPRFFNENCTCIILHMHCISELEHGNINKTIWAKQCLDQPGLFLIEIRFKKVAKRNVESIVSQCKHKVTYLIIQNAYSGRCLLLCAQVVLGVLQCVGALF